MPLFVKRNDTKEIVKVRKYIIDDQGEENIWSNEWYGRHTIGKDCAWAVVALDEDCPYCAFLQKTFCNNNDRNDREYYLMTEVFVYLHGGCTCNFKETDW